MPRLRAAFADMLASTRQPYCYTMVGVDFYTKHLDGPAHLGLDSVGPGSLRPGDAARDTLGHGFDS